jgi:hypothetical protein
MLRSIRRGLGKGVDIRDPMGSLEWHSLFRALEQPPQVDHGAEAT